MSDLSPTQAPPLCWGIMAPGWIAGKFATAVRELTRGSVVAVGSRSADRAEAFAEVHGIPHVHEGYAALAADEDVQAVYVASPHSQHRDQALTAIRAGKHVMVEKAFARNRGEVEEILTAASQADVTVMEAMWTRHLPHIAWVRERIAAGAIGDIVAVSADHGQALDLPADHRLKDPALAGGALLDLGVYPVAFIIDLLGAPLHVQAAGHLTGTGVDGHMALTLTYPGRVLARADTTLWTKTPTVAAISGTEGSLEIDGDFYQPSVARLRRADDERTVVEEFDGRVPNGFQFQIAEMARLVADGRRESPRITWESTRQIMAVMDEARRQVGVVYPGE